MPKPTLTAERLREILDYDPATGRFTWRQLTFGRNKVGGLAGRLTNNGVRQITIDGTAYTARKLVWLYLFGEWPAGNLWAINHDPDDLRIDNLRPMKDGPDLDGGLTAQLLRLLLTYETDTGNFRWRINVGEQRFAGEIAQTGCPDCYQVISLGRRQYRCNRLAVLHVTGNWPVGVVDHLNGRKDDNRWGNLRDVSTAINSQNQRHARSDSKSGVLGVHWRQDRQKWQTTIKGPQRRVHVGYFDTAEEGGQAYIQAKRQLHPGCTL